MSPGTAPETSLGIPGFSFADLHQPARLRELYRQFAEDVTATEPELWAQWDQHRTSPGALGAVARGNLIVAMAPHVSRFITRLFGVGAEAESLVEATRAYDVLFRFKIDFVRRRALPLLKHPGAAAPPGAPSRGGAHVTATPADHALIDEVLNRSEGDGSSRRQPGFDEMALAQFGCSLLDREAADKAAVADEIESLKRWCAAHIHDPRYRRLGDAAVSS